MAYDAYRVPYTVIKAKTVWEEASAEPVLAPCKVFNVVHTFAMEEMAYLMKTCEEIWNGSQLCAVLKSTVAYIAIVPLSQR